MYLNIRGLVWGGICNIPKCREAIEVASLLHMALCVTGFLMPWTG